VGALASFLGEYYIPCSLAIVLWRAFKYVRRSLRVGLIQSIWNSYFPCEQVCAHIVEGI
jgi:hypothetical protein